jgi:hypothetical protein
MFFRLAAFFWLTVVVAQAQTAVTLYANQLRNGQAVELDKHGWKYSPGDDPAWADPQLDDRAWATLADSAMPEDSPDGWRGTGWFRQQELTLAADDVVVLMSNGLPERFNAEGEMLDDTRIRRTLAVIAHQPSEQIINELVRLGDEWGAGRPQDDDITFVVLKLRSVQERRQEQVT